MPELELRFIELVQALGDDALLGEVLLFPEASCFHHRSARLRAMLLRHAVVSLKRLPAGTIYKRRLGELPTIGAVDVQIPPLRDSVCRAGAVTLTFHYVQWRHGDDALIAYIPALQIEVLAETERQLHEQLVPEIRSALARRKAAESPRELVMLGRVRDLRVTALPTRVELPTAKQTAQRERARGDRQKSVLRQVATDLTLNPAPPIYQRDADLARLVQQLTGGAPRSVLLVGRSGVGKTALVHELARRRREFAVARTPLWSTSGSRIIAGASGFGMWQQRCQQLVREAAKTKAIVHLDNLIELLEVGKGGGATQGIAAMLRPAIARGALLAIAECTPEQLALIERSEPQLLEAFAQLEVAESNESDTRAILAQVADAVAAGLYRIAPSAGRRAQRKRQRKQRRKMIRRVSAAPSTTSEVSISPEALATLDRLHRRYATYSASPGRPLRFLRNLLEDRSTAPLASASIGSSEVTAAFSRETGLPLFMLDDAEPLNLDTTRAWFSERVIGQDAAVATVVQLLAAVKAGLARGGKPIGSLLFIGPTGVGKTEMAKALAEFLYRDPGRMIRFDMSEYAHPAAVERLIGGGCATRGLLTQKVRDQPFMVVLLDEFEKADPLLFDVLLQVLGEGRLTDGAGRVADFTNSVVIMTSNLGAETFGRSLRGFAGDDATVADARQHFEREVKAFLRPEMFNRLDQIVAFAPLERSTIAGIARREIDRVSRRDGLRRRGIRLDVDAAAVARLADRGFDPAYGARPLKRAIERQLVAPLAERLTRLAGDASVLFRVGLVDDELQIDAHARPRQSVRPLDVGASDTAAVAMPDAAVELQALSRLVTLRRKLQTLDQSGVVLALRNEVVRLQQARRQEERRHKKRNPKTPPRFSQTNASLIAQEKRLQQVDDLVNDIYRIEDQTLEDYYAGRATDPKTLSGALDAIEQSLVDLLFELDRSRGGRRSAVTIVIFGASHGRVLELAEAYRRVCEQQSGRLIRYWLKMYQSKLDAPADSQSRGESSAGRADVLRPVMRLKSRPMKAEDESRKVVDVYNPAERFADLPSDCIGVALQITGERAAALLETESGQHMFVRGPGQPVICFVETISDLLLKYDPPANIGRQGALSELPQRRVYDFNRELCQDSLLHEQLPLGSRGIDSAVTAAAEQYLNQRLWNLLEPWN